MQTLQDDKKSLRYVNGLILHFVSYGNLYRPTSRKNVFHSLKLFVSASTVSKIFLAILLFLGLFMCFFGHQYFKCEMFILGFLAASLVSYILIAQQGSLDATGN